MSYCMVIDLKRCVGCNGCTNHCKEENGTPPGITRAKVMKKESGKYPNVSRRSYPMLCMHCADPACVSVCPTGATVKRDDGIVTVDKDICVGCKACMVACPYSARYYRKDDNGYFGPELTPYEKVKYENMPKGVVDKCDFCLSRLKKGQKPACVELCVTQARHFGTKEELAPLIQGRKAYQLLPELGTDPQVYYID